MWVMSLCIFVNMQIHDITEIPGVLLYSLISQISTINTKSTYHIFVCYQTLTSAISLLILIDDEECDFTTLLG